MPMNIEIDNAKMILKVTLSGIVTSGSVTEQVVTNYNSIISKVDPKRYSLLIDCTNMGVFQQDAMLSLNRLFHKYMETGFKNIVFINSKNAIQNMQLSKTARDVPGFSGVFVDNMTQALIACS